MCITKETFIIFCSVLFQYQTNSFFILSLSLSLVIILYIHNNIHKSKPKKINLTPSRSETHIFSYY